MTKIRLALLLAALAAVLPMAVQAAIPRPVPLAPKKGASFARGNTPTFKARSTGSGSVWLFVSKSPKRNADGLIKNDAVIQKMRRKSGSVFTAKPKEYTFPSYWAMTPRVYYWQVHRISCGEEDDTNSDCSVEGPVRKFRIR